MEQTHYNLLFRWFIGLSMDDEVWVPGVFTKHRERLIGHDAVTEFFNEVLKIASKKHWPSGEHFSVEGTLIQGKRHKSFVRMEDDDADGDDDPGADANNDGANFKGQRDSNDTHESKTAGDARLYRKGKTASELRYEGVHPERQPRRADSLCSDHACRWICRAGSGQGHDQRLPTGKADPTRTITLGRTEATAHPN